MTNAAPQPVAVNVSVAAETIWHVGWPEPVATHTGSDHGCHAAAGFGAGPAAGAPSNFRCRTVTWVLPPTQRVRTDSTGAPGWSTKLRMMRFTGFSVTRVISIQKSSPAALPEL